MSSERRGAFLSIVCKHVTVMKFVLMEEELFFFWPFFRPTVRVGLRVETHVGSVRALFYQICT